MSNGESEPPVSAHVFEDKTGSRLKRVSIFSLILLFVIIGFAIEFATRVHNLKPSMADISATLDQSLKYEGVAFNSNATTITMKENAYTDCGQSLFNFSKNATGIAGYVPFGDPTALSGLRAHCADLDSVYYQAFQFGTQTGGIRELSENGARFPLSEFHNGRNSRNRPTAYPILSPIIGTTSETLEQIFSQPRTRSELQTQLKLLDLTDIDGGLCIDLSEYPKFRADALLPMFEWINTWLSSIGLSSCLIGSIDAEFWSSQALTSKIERPVLLGFKSTHTPFETIALQSWFDGLVDLAKKTIPQEKISYGLGSFSTVWKSGQRSSEQIPFSEAMLRAHTFNGTISFDADIGNTNIRYLDDDRRLNQVWNLDATSFSNQRSKLDENTQAIIWPLGYEDPAVWKIIAGPDSNVQPKTAIEAPVNLSEHVVAEGAGPFSTHISQAVTGLRQVTLNADSGRIETQTYSQIPSPQRVQLFGQSTNLSLAISFNGVGNVRETEILLDLLEHHAISATFFLTTRDLLLSAPSVQNLLAAGHTVGADTLPRESRSLLSEYASKINNNLPQHLLQHKFGLNALLVQNPSRYGQLPGDQAVLEQFQTLQTSGYLPVFNNFSAPYGKFDPLAFVYQVSISALDRPANVLSFDFSRQNDFQLNVLLPEILQNLAANGFTFTTLPSIADLKKVQVLPSSEIEPKYRDRAIFWLMAITWIGVQNFIFLLALIVALRSPIYLFLAFLRREKFRFISDYSPPITVIIPAYNEERVVLKTINSTLASDYPNLKVIVVDDGSTDQTASVAAKVAASNESVTFLKQQNIGKWAAINRAVRQLETPFFVVVDADTLLQKDAIKHLVQPFRDERVGAVAGTVRIGNRDNIITSCQVVEYMISQNVMRRAYEVFNGILVVPGAIGAWRASAVAESGYVSGETVTEDADLTVAVHRADYKVMYTPEALSYTEAPNAIRAFMRQRLRWSLGMLQVAWKHKGAISEGYAVGFVSIIDAVWYRVVSSFVYPWLT